MSTEKHHLFTNKKLGNRPKNKSTEASREMGFGSNSAIGATRMLNKDGTYNYRRTGLPLSQRFHLYHTLIDMSWTKFNLAVLIVYIIINSVFAGIYYMVGVEHLAGIKYTTEWQKFYEAFFFSAQTITTVGYGRMSPEGLTASGIAALESMIGLMGFALITGILYGKFSRPQAKIMFSNKAIIAPYRGITAFEFRIVNERSNQLIEVEVQVVVSMNKTTEGNTSRVFLALKLETSKVNFFPLPWTIVHPIEEDSPMYGYDSDAFNESDAEFIILVKAFDDSFSQMVYKRFSYRYNEIEWGAKYNIIYKKDEDGIVNLQLDKFQEIEKVPLS